MTNENESGVMEGVDAEVEAGSNRVAMVTITYLDKDGVEQIAETALPELDGKANGNEIDLREEGRLNVVDLSDKKQKDRKLKLQETRDEHGMTVAEWCAFSIEAKKFVAIIRCKATGEPCRKYTSDLHQSFYSDAAASKAKRERLKAKRAANKGS